MKLHVYYVYILTNEYHTVLYTGVTNDLVRRCFEHKEKKNKGFTRKYNVNKLIYFEEFDHIEEAILREKQLKGYSRSKKVALIDTFNNEWINIYIDGRIKVPVFLKEEERLGFLNKSQ